MTLISWLVLNASVAEAGTPFTQSYKVVGIESAFACSQQKARNPAAVCTPKITEIPEAVTMKITSNGTARKFELASGCHSLRASLVPKGERVEVSAAKETSRCAGKDMSLQHEALFSNAQKITKVEEMSDGRMRARVDDMLGIILAPAN